MGRISDRIGGLVSAWVVGSLIGDAIQREEARKRKNAAFAKMLGEDPNEYHKTMTKLEQSIAMASARRRLGK